MTAYKLIPKSEYLSGNVRRKLDRATTAAALNPIFLHNVAQLTDAQPSDVPIADIDTTFSSIWIPLRFFQAFIHDVLSIDAHVQYTEVNSAWCITPRSAVVSMANTSTYGVSWQGYTIGGKLNDYKLTAIEMIELAMNFKTPAITRRAFPAGDTMRDLNLTAGAIEKQRQLQDRFNDWLREDPDRRHELERIYNDKFNNVKLPVLDGSHLTLPGMSAKWRSRIRDYQINGIYRGMLGTAGIFYEVGLGKTATAFGIIMERKRVDPTSKAVLIVKRSTLKQIASSFKEVYPNAHILVATPNDCTKGKRQLFMARIAAGNYDCVVMTQQQYESLMLRPETLKNHIEPLLARVRAALADHGIEDDEDSNKKKRKSFVIKNLERMRNRLKQQIEDMAATKDKGLFFEDLGLNFIVADEADSYLNAPLLTKLEGITGLSMTASNIATDFEWKAEWLRQTYGTGRLVLMTGTFIRNTLANLYVMQRLMQPEALEERGIHCFDAWASMFGRIRTSAEVTTDGKISRKSRFSEFVNLPELLQMFFSVAEVKRYEDVQGADFTRPTPKFVNVLAPMSFDQLEIMNSLVARAIAIRSGNPDTLFNANGDKRLDNLLWVTTDGRKASLDARMLRPWAEDFHKSKINQCVRRVFKIWKRTAAQKSTQMVFLDFSTPAATPSMYRDVRAKWVRLGIPIEQIAFIHDYETDEQKAKLFEDVNAGIVRVVIGSTPMMGVGVNVQAKMIALHHLDCPWRPCDLEQREGRILRSGNENSRVLIYRYVTQGVGGNCGFDSFMWQLVEAKSRFIRQIMRGDLTMRRMEEDASEDPTFSAGQVKALATGDIRIMRHVEVEAELERLSRLKRSIEMDTDTLRHGRHNSINSIPYSRRKVTEAQETLSDQMRDFDLVRQMQPTCSGDQFAIKLLGVDYTDRIAAGEVLAQCARDLTDHQENHNNWRRIGFYGGFELLMISDDGRSTRVFLRGPSQATYKVQLVLDRRESGNRVQEAYAKVLESESNALYALDDHRKRIIDFEAELDRKAHQLGDVRSQIQEFTLEKTQLEAELGLNQAADRAIEEVGGDTESLED